jgi:hypothetical protein
MALRRFLARAGALTPKVESVQKSDFAGDRSIEALLGGLIDVVPQRYGSNRERYLRRANVIEVDALLEAFVAGSRHVRPDLPRFYFFCLAFDQLLKEGIEGDVAELGVYKGNTAMILAAMARRFGTTAWLLDTYEGFAASDLQGVDADKQMEFADTSLEAVQRRVGKQNVQFVKGYFPATASQIPDDRRFCFVHIDCDLYAPMRSALEYFYDRLVPGGYLLMHDYSSLHWDGAERAVDEFFADKPECVISVPDSAGSVVIRKARVPSKYDNWFVGRWDSGFAKVWIEAGRGAISELLRTGWSAPEDWGVWGIGKSHELAIYLTSPAAGVMVLEVDCAAALVGPRHTQVVEVWSDGNHLDTWTFTRDANRAVRSVQVPVPAEAGHNALPAVVVEFRPRFIEPPVALDPSVHDDRPLGLGVYRLRQRIGAAETPPRADTSA